MSYVNYEIGEQLCDCCDEANVFADGIICLDCGGTFCEECMDDHPCIGKIGEEDA